MKNDAHDLSMETLYRQLGHAFSDASLLSRALVHPSLMEAKARRSGQSSAYERLEFLGDRVLGLIVAHWLYEMYPDASEGELAKRHAALVNRDTLKKVALEIDLAQHVRYAKGDETSAPRKNLAVLSDAMEAVIGALYLDAGLPAAQAFIKDKWQHEIVSAQTPADPKTELQEYAQAKRSWVRISSRAWATEMPGSVVGM